MNRNKSKNKVIINYNILPKTIKHGKECFDYNKFNGLKVDFTYKNIKDFFIIENVIRKGRSYQIVLNYNNGLFITSIANFKTGTFYKGILRYSYKYNIGSIVGNNKILDRRCEKTVYPSQISYPRQYYCECINCGHKSWKFEFTLNDKSQCSACGKFPKTVVEGINDIPTTAPWMIPYFQGGYNEAKQYVKCSHIKINPICPYCGEVKKNKIAISNIYNSNGISCVCNDSMSYPNKLMYNILRIKNIEFISEYSPDWIKPKRYDFYISSKNIIIEMDGGWHYKDNNLSKKSKEEIKLADNLKDQKAYEHNITVYRIDCKKSDCDYIYNNILKSELNYILQISKEDILQADMKSHNNLIKEICEYKNKQDNMTSSAVAEYFGLSKDTVQIYAKIGEKYGWCKSFKPYFNYKCILLTKENTKIGIFKNAERVSIYLKKKYNTDISAMCIRHYILNDINYKDFHFEDLDKEQSSYFLQSDFNWDYMIFQNDIMQKMYETKVY